MAPNALFPATVKDSPRFAEAVRRAMGLPTVTYEIVKVTPRSSGVIRWRCTCLLPLTREQLMNLQTETGFHPGGYGFSELGQWEDDDGFYYSWTCSDNAD